jgi:hypothetical protein
MPEVLRTNGLLVAGAALSTAITSNAHTRIADDSLLGFLALLALLLVLALIAIIRFEPPERAYAAEEPAQAAVPAPAVEPPRWAPGVPAPQPGPRRVAPAPQPGRHHVAPASQPRPRPVTPVPLPVRVPGQQPGYTARHAPNAASSQGTPERPRVTGGPPWGPAPRPPGLDPFLRSSD